ncbi:hypothetical protein ACETRX_01465 [Labrys portucalensis]|uniref:Uncharacterized protein n=1 Tax=Labrys neptuniae TaxID=376174 RepID=A0ABV6Z7W4_9HYPH
MPARLSLRAGGLAASQIPRLDQPLHYYSADMMIDDDPLSLHAINLHAPIEMKQIGPDYSMKAWLRPW